MTYISLGSHRARQKMEYALNEEPPCYFSMWRGTTGGYYLLADEQLERLKQAGVNFSKLKGPHEDILKCWSWY